MGSALQEVEAKFHVLRLQDLEKRVLQRGGALTRARTLETNLRFDTPDGQLRRGHQALRLRRDTVVTLTYKGSGELDDGIRSRPELEVGVADLEQARAVLEGLGYVVIFMYEKYRTTYRLGSVDVMLDELPYGDFVELEGKPDQLKPAAAQLGLRWEAAIPASYHSLFEDLRSALDLPFRDLTFDNFAHTPAHIEALHLAEADA
jgi:adenylate cyclase, class 2